MGSCLAAVLAAKDAEACPRWSNLLSDCDVLTDCVDVTPTETAYYRRRVYKDTAEQACTTYWFEYRRHYGIYWNGQPAGTKTCGVVVYYSATGAHCHPDYNCNNVADRNELSDDAPVVYGDVPRDSCCELTPNGPYTHLNDDPDFQGIMGNSPIGAGQEFDWYLKQAVLFENNQIWLGNGIDANQVRSDSFGLLAVPPSDYWEALNWDSGGFQGYNYWDTYNDPDYKVVWNNNTLQNYQQKGTIDHIIPRIDSHGCACGSNDVSNAAVISGSVNSSMSNMCEDPRRIAMLNAYTLP